MQNMQTPEAANQQLYTLFEEAGESVHNKVDSVANIKTKTVALLRFDGKEFHFEKRWGAGNGKILGTFKRWLQNIVICISGKKEQYNFQKNWGSLQRLFNLASALDQNKPERETLAAFLNTGLIKKKMLTEIAISTQAWWKSTQDDKNLKTQFRKVMQSPEVVFEQEIDKCKNTYNQFVVAHKSSLKDITKTHSSLMGHVNWIPKEFEFWMPGVALIASYLGEKRQVDPSNTALQYANNLYSCETMDAFSKHLQNVANSGADGRYAYVVPAIPSRLGTKQYGAIPQDYPQHKVAVLVEKKGGKVQIAMMDPQASEEKVRKNEFLDWKDENKNLDIWQGHGKIHSTFTGEELILRAICKAKIKCETDVFILPGTIQRETAFGCALFSLCDCETFLMDDAFFKDKSLAQDKDAINDGNLHIGYMKDLGPDYMLGTQSVSKLEAYTESHKDVQSQKLLGKKRTFQEHVAHHKAAKVLTKKGDYKDRNQYIMWKMFFYSHLVNKALALLTPEQLQAKVSKHLVR